MEFAKARQIWFVVSFSLLALYLATRVHDKLPLRSEPEEVGYCPPIVCIFVISVFSFMAYEIGRDKGKASHSNPAITHFKAK